MRRVVIFLLLVPTALFALPYAILSLGVWAGPPLLFAAVLLLARTYASVTREAA